MARIELRPPADRPAALRPPAAPVRPAPDGLVLVEDFENFSVGPLAYDSSPAGEHHLLEPRSWRGRWVEGTLEPDADRGAGWNIVEYCGNHVLELSEAREGGAPVPIVGDPDWTDLTVSVAVRRLSRCRAGLVLRFADGRAHYRLLLDGKAVRLLGRLAEQTAVLAEAPAACDDFESHELSAELCGDRITVSLDGRAVLQARDGAFAAGRVGVFADGPAQFDDLRVTVPDKVRRAAVQSHEQEARLLHEMREALPRPKLWKRFAWDGFGCGRALRWGDLDADGRPEMLAVQAQSRFGRQTVGCVTAVDLDGNALWRFGEPARSPAAPLPTADLPAQIHDIDGDGFDEVVVVREFVIHVLDGRTGEPKAAGPAPETADGPAALALPAGLFFADLSGRLRAGDVVLTDGRRTVWAFAGDLHPLWRATVPDARSVLPVDIDGDGREELFAGSTLLDAQGREIWSIPAEDVRAVAVIRGKTVGDVRIVVAAGADGLLILDRQGRVVAEDRDTFLHSLALGRFRPDLGGVQIWAQGRRESAGALVLFDSTGRRLCTRAAHPAAGAVCPVNWTGDSVELLLHSAHPEHGGLVDAFGRAAVSFPKDGGPVMCSRALPLCEDGRDAIACWDPAQVAIYVPEKPTAGGAVYRPRRPPMCNDSLYRAAVSEPPG